MTNHEKFTIALIVCVLIVSVPFARFRFAHPCLTETELIIHTWDALMWRTLDVCNDSNEKAKVGAHL